MDLELAAVVDGWAARRAGRRWSVGRVAGWAGGLSVVALAGEVVAGGGGPVGGLVVVEGHGPAVAVGDAVVVAAEGDEVGEVGGAALLPGGGVVEVAPVDGGVASGEGAACVADGDGVALGGGGEPAAMADVDGDAHFVDEHSPHVRVTTPGVDGSLGEWGAVGGTGLLVVRDEGDLERGGCAGAGFGADGGAEQFDQGEGAQGGTPGDGNVGGGVVVAGELVEQFVGFGVDRGAYRQAVCGVEGAGQVGAPVQGFGQAQFVARVGVGFDAVFVGEFGEGGDVAFPLGERGAVGEVDDLVLGCGETAWCNAGLVTSTRALA